MNAHDFTDALIERSTKGAIQATQPAEPMRWKAQGPFVIVAGRMEAWQLCVCVVPSTVDPRPTPDAAAKDKATAERYARLIAEAPAMADALRQCITPDPAYGTDTPTLRARLAAINTIAETILSKLPKH